MIAAPTRHRAVDLVRRDAGCSAWTGATCHPRRKGRYELPTLPPELVEQSGTRLTGAFISAQADLAAGDQS